jgi:hypothetical protein
VILIEFSMGIRICRNSQKTKRRQISNRVFWHFFSDFPTPASEFESLDLVGEHSVKSEGRPRGLLNVTEETLPA